MNLVPPPSPCAPDGVIHLKTQPVPDCAQMRHQDAETRSPCQRACWFVYPDRLICRCFSLGSASCRFLLELEHRMEENIVISDVCDIVYRYAADHFSVYITYVSNQTYQERTYKQLL